MLIHDVMAELRRRYESRPIGPSVPPDVLDGWRAGSDLSRLGLLDQVAAALAFGFHEGRLKWEFCDHVVNALVWTLYADPPRPDGAEWADLFWQAYLAFDAGEYRRAAQPQADPILAYTRPLVAAIVDRLRPAG